MKTIKSFILLASVAFLAASCQPDSFTGGKNKKMGLTVTTDGGVETKSGESLYTSEPIELSTEGLTLYMTESVSRNSMNPFESYETKGEIVTTESLKTVRDAKFPIRLTSASHNPYVETYGVYKDNKWDFESDQVWPLDADGVRENVNAFAYSFGGSTGVVTSDYGQTGKYSMAPTSDATDAEALSDLLVAKTTGVTPMNAVPVHFYHALAAVRFVVPNTNEYKVKRIEINNVYTEASWSYNDKASADDVDRFDWAIASDATTSDYKQSFASSSSVQSEYTDHSFVGTEAESTFFIIPQGLEDVAISLYFEDASGKEYFLTTSMKIASSWEAGYVYTYRIGTGADMDGEVKIMAEEDTAVKNIATSAVYVRASIIANWFNSADKLVGPSTIKNLSVSSDWIKDGDYYYYKYPVVSADETPALVSSISFESAPSDIAMTADHIETTYVYQAVECGSVNVWPASATSQLEPLK